MTGFFELVKRNTKLFFRDRGMFFTALVTPLILLLLYSTFLANLYEDTFISIIPTELNVDEGLIESAVAGQLVSSLLAVSCVTVAFCSNFLMVQDKVTGSAVDFRTTPVRSSTLSTAYFISSFAATLLICAVASVAGLFYMYTKGLYMTWEDIGYLCADIVLLTMFGTALSSVVNFFLNTQGQISAVGTIVSAGYGFVCGAYIPISQFSESMRNFIAYVPATYGTSLLRNHIMSGTLKEMENENIPKQLVDVIRDTVDCNVYFREKAVDMENMYIIIISSIVVLLCLYIGMNAVKSGALFGKTLLRK